MFVVVSWQAKPLLLVFHNSIFHRAISLLVEMPAQALTTTVPPFQKLVLFSGNVMRSSVAGRTKVVNKKGNAEVEFVFLLFGMMAKRKEAHTIRWAKIYGVDHGFMYICIYSCLMQLMIRSEHHSAILIVSHTVIAMMNHFLKYQIFDLKVGYCPKIGMMLKLQVGKKEQDWLVIMT